MRIVARATGSRQVGNLEREYLGGTCACVVLFVGIVRLHHKLVKPMFTLIV